MDPLTDGLAAAKAIKVAKDVLQHFRNRAKTTEDAAKLLELQDAFQTLRADNSRLREELQECKDRAAARSAFEQRQIGEAVVLVRVGVDGTEGPPCCPLCQDVNGEPLPLQALPSTFRDFGSHHCTSCDGNFQLR